MPTGLCAPSNTGTLGQKTWKRVMSSMLQELPDLWCFAAIRSLFCCCLGRRITGITWKRFTSGTQGDDLKPAEGVPGSLVPLSSSEKSGKVSKRPSGSPVLGSEAQNNAQANTDPQTSLKVFTPLQTELHKNMQVKVQFLTTTWEQKGKAQINKDMIFFSFGKSFENSKL